ncbi:MAG: ABC transporter ATP-binding protein [Synergistaceae bacterium]
MNISVNNLSVKFGSKQILDSLFLDIEDKKITGIIGPNGSGKSTLLKCLYQTLKTEKETIYFDGQDIKSISLKQAALKLAVVAQHNHYNFDFSVIDVVLLGRTPHKTLMESDNELDYKIAMNSLDKVGIKEFASRSFSTLSGGEQQRVILARALAQQTECLILDEPTNHLDIKYQLKIMDLVKKENLSVVAAIHDLNIASTYCNNIIAMKDGKIFASGTPEKIITQTLMSDLYEVDTSIIKNPQTGKLMISFLSAL